MDVDDYEDDDSRLEDIILPGMIPDVIGIIFKFIPKEYFWMLRFVCKNWNQNMNWIFEKYKYDKCFYLYDGHLNISKKILSICSSKGNLNQMKWIYKKGCKLYKNVFSSAAKNGNLENMKWLYKNGCPIDEKYKSVEFGKKNSIAEICEIQYENRNKKPKIFF